MKLWRFQFRQQHDIYDTRVVVVPGFSYENAKSLALALMAKSRLDDYVLYIRPSISPEEDAEGNYEGHIIDTSE